MESVHAQRSVGDILWGCLATIFACSWVSVHPNIPPPDVRWWQITLVRIELMVWTMLAPELIILLAAKQWIAARHLKSVYEERGWTITHGFFIQMGGFMLFDGGIRKGVISPHRFQELIKEKQIMFPEITEEEIKDRSKGDGLSKGLVLVQVAWFVAQFTARRAEGLAIAQIELATFAFAALNGFMYFFWWNKPLDVRLPIPIHLLHPMVPESRSALPSFSEGSNTELPNSITLPDSKHPPHTAISSSKRISKLNRLFQHWGSWQCIIVKAWKSRAHVVDDSSDFQLLDTMSVPIFFSSLVGPYSTIRFGYVIAAILGMVFGAIHCAGWNLAFPSDSEGHIWRIASVVIVAYPALFLLAFILDSLFPVFWKKVGKYWGKRYLWIKVVNILWRVSFPMYIISRVFILLEAFLALRSLSNSATYAVQWTAVLPHI